MKLSQKKEFGFYPPEADKNRGGREVYTDGVAVTALAVNTAVF